MVNRGVAAALGALTGIVGLIGMLRLIIAGVGPSAFGVGFVLAAMLPWIVYAGYRAQHGRLTIGKGLVVFGCCVVGLITVWLFTLGAVIALVLSLAAFAVIWISDWPAVRPQTESRFVHIEELTREDLDTAH
jgi:hypothetical protein